MSEELEAGGFDVSYRLASTGMAAWMLRISSTELDRLLISVMQA